jgi:diguanylate cyclase (GGDEF)-like protein/PAS domain S-box-containing protein
MEESDIIPAEVLASMLMRMFEFAPIAMAITTSDTETSSYAKVNDAYLRLTGLKWENIRGKRLTSEGSAIDSPARDRRHRLLAEEGSYVLEEVDIVHADGTTIPTLISAQRTVVDGVSFDVEVIVDVSSRVRQQREMEIALKTSARTDALSGLPNRARFDEVLAERISSAGPQHDRTALAFIDLNGFKAVNDTMGHAAGDDVLRTIASRLRSSFRPADFIARIGGDEFVVLFDVDPMRIVELQQRLQETMESVFKPIAVDGNVTYTGAAVGVAFLEADDTAQSLVKRADNFMYTAKTTGERVAIVCFGQILQHAERPARLTKAKRL